MNPKDFNLTADQIEKVKACKTPEELLALAKQEGMELTEEQIDSISGGGGWNCTGYITPYPEC